MPKPLRRPRSIAYASQGGRCFYCQAPTWLKAPDQFASKYRFTPGEIRVLQATAEHLIARQDGGGNSLHNIVAACWLCNSRRHRRQVALPPEEFKRFVAWRIKQGRWHSQRILSFLMEA